MVCTKRGHFSFSASNCSGLGVCDGDKCVCDSGFSGSTHWVNADGEDCFISLGAIRALWAIVISAFVILLFWHVPSYFRALKRYKAIQAQLRKVGKTAPSLLDDTLFVCMTIFLVLIIPSTLGLAVWLTLDPEARIGGDVGPTLLWFLGRSGFYWCASIFQPQFLRGLLGTRKSSSQNASLKLSVELSTWKLTAAHLCLGGLVLVPLLSNDPTAEIASWVLFNLGTASVISLIGWVGYRMKKDLILQLEDAKTLVSESQVSGVLGRLKVLQKVVIRGTAFQFTVHFLFGVIPWFYAAFTYFVPISFLMATRLSSVLVQVLQNEPHAGKGGSDPSADVSATNAESDLTFGTVLEISRVEDHNLLDFGSQFGRPSGRSTGRSTEKWSETT